jgi:RimJ/RimL family protein N-acetyltransferase
LWRHGGKLKAALLQDALPNLRRQISAQDSGFSGGRTSTLATNTPDRRYVACASRLRKCPRVASATRHDKIRRMPRPTVTSQRIRLAPLTTEHLPLLVELDSDPEVLRYIIGRARSSVEALEFWKPICADTGADMLGLGHWVGFARDSDDFLGWWNLQPDEPKSAKPAGAEAGWRLARRQWRRGYASEGATALLDHGFDRVGLDTVWAETMAVNRPSRGVMVKLGMRHVQTKFLTWDDPLPGAEEGEVVYQISRQEWQALRSHTTPN